MLNKTFQIVSNNIAYIMDSIRENIMKLYKLSLIIINKIKHTYQIF